MNTFKGIILCKKLLDVLNRCLPFLILEYAGTHFRSPDNLCTYNKMIVHVGHQGLNYAP